jgi:hypothetical protein
MGEGRNVYRVWVGKPRGKNHLKDQGANGRMGGVWSGFTWLRIGAFGALL